ncbi:extracellular solute-binding protein [Rhodophyticola sp. CCM32]|uniref:extracellular solute-binding protein n=1 Tax=Rhodophyticola sp. CCM32 TaxID=2916397 RepID=UPI00143CCBD7|nr:extracellular solute-binding protein [Rhodophyticola sp. CCM32]
MKKTLIMMAACAGMVGPVQADTTLSIARFFGACENAGTDFANAVGEACIIQALINAYSEADNGVTMETREVAWASFYDQMKAGYAANTPPDIHVIHQSRIPEFADIGLLADMSEDLAPAGIDIEDWEDRALEGSSHNGAIYAVPLDFHTLLWHVNMELMEQAGLVADGAPILPGSPEELLAHAQQFQEATGVNYLALDLNGNIGSHVVVALALQQNAELIVDDEANFDTEEMHNAVQLIVDIVEQGFANPTNDYPAAQADFFNGQAGILINGTWVVDQFTAEAANPESALSDYYVATQPTLFDVGATWGGSHAWAIPASLQANDPETYQAAIGFLDFLNDNNLAWAKTGHLSVRESVLASEAYNTLPHRSEYAGSAEIARSLPRSTVAWSIRDVVKSILQSTYLADVPIDEALVSINEGVQDILDDQ